MKLPDNTINCDWANQNDQSPSINNCIEAMLRLQTGRIFAKRIIARDADSGELLRSKFECAVRRLVYAGGRVTVGARPGNESGDQGA